MLSLSSRTRTLAVIACGTIAAGVGLALFFWRRRQQPTRETPAAGAPSKVNDDDDNDDHHSSSTKKSKEEGDARNVEENAAREKEAQAYFDGVGGFISSAIPFDEDDEDSSGGPFDDEEFIDGEENIEAMLDRDAAAAKEAERDGSFTGAAEEPDHNMTKNRKDENYRSVPEVERDGSFAGAAAEPDYIVTKDSNMKIL